jgi:hypothetical protein
MPSFLRFERQPRLDGRKTERWAIFNRTEGVQLGEIHFRPGWRKYTFTQAAPGIDWDAKCLTEIVNFLDDQTLLWRQGNHADGSDTSVRSSAVSV